jgi:uncharacterized protein (TIGR02001 family)
MPCLRHRLCVAACCSTLLAGLLIATDAKAFELSGGVGLTSDYVWRGETQSSGDASVSGSVKLAFDNALSVGLWVGSLGKAENDNPNYELNVFAAYTGMIDQLAYEAGIIAYHYPGIDGQERDATDIYGRLGFGPLSASYYYQARAENDALEDESAQYVSLDASFPLTDGWFFGLHAGLEFYDTLETDEDFALSVNKDSFTLTASQNEGDDTRVSVSWGVRY